MALLHYPFSFFFLNLFQPFGEGLVTVVVPQLRRGENSLLLWNVNNQTAPVHTFVGHTDVVLEFEWRRVNQGTGACFSILVTASPIQIFLKDCKSSKV